jgi:uncharacterized protein YbaR (Trm112 family)
MKKSFLTMLICPVDKTDLHINIFMHEGEEILEGILICKKCLRYYPIVQGVPIISPDEYRDALLELSVLEKWGKACLVENGSQPFKLKAPERLPTVL